MTYRRYAVPVFVASLLFAACGSDPPPEPPAPQQQAPPTQPPAQPPAQPTGPTDAQIAAARRALENTLTQPVHFDYDQSVVRADAEAALRQKAEILRNSPTVTLRIEGHADERGSTEYNLALGNRRAEAVRQFLVGFSLGANRFAILSYGEERPAAMGSNETAWARNRRAEFVITGGTVVVTIDGQNY